MEQIETRKSLQKTKSALIFLMVFAVLCIPAIVKTFTKAHLWLAITALSFIFLACYRRVQRLNYKLRSLE
jgi:hypothetical protein